ncbi:Bug family tripartite tricarboxylate transporter substrate binding protein [Variovorax sp. RA8]|uniref:Bug family tripartite tricarboxylate transporter substrate binding protein n=1 Tax=Variovorax sp. (strain JCM 16519 / RA8) TaxID=662548 RepID=UPI001E65753F|nr:tripartite tricarboxylate transporter substrate-binding protein [Variovorax sp. RA8]
MFALVVAHTAPAIAQDSYPTRSVRIVVPSSVGGGADLLARQLGAGLQQRWKQGISVENKVGGGGNIGTLDVVRSPPDGYTLLVQNSSMVANYAISAKKPYSPEKDLTPIMLVGVSPLAVFAHPSLRANNIRDLVSLANADPGAMSYGSCGVGTPHHFAMEILKIKLAMKIEHVSYKGCSPEVTDVVAGQVPLGIATANLIAPYVATGRLKVLGVSGSKPHQLLPGSPTLESQGLSIQDFSIWYALMGPANMPAHLVNRIASDAAQILDSPTVRTALSNAGVEPLRGGPEVLAKRISLEMDQLSKLAKQANIQPE